MTGRFSRRTASTGSALVVAAIAAVASYSHMRHLAIEYGQTESIADMLPVSVDGMLVVATLALGDGRRYRWSAWLAFWVGVSASITANVLAAEPSTIARCISAWPALAFLFVVEVITRGGRGRTPEPVPAPAPVVAEEPVPVPEPVADDVPDERSPKPTKATPVIARVRKRNPAASKTEVATKAGVSLATVRRQWPITEPPEPATAGSANGAAAAHLLRTTD